MKVERTIHPSSLIPHPFLLFVRAGRTKKVVPEVLVGGDLGQAADAVMSARPLSELSRGLLVHDGSQSFCTPL